MKFVLQKPPNQSRTNCIKAVQDSPDGFVVEIKAPVKEKTDKQNATLFGIAYPPIMAHMGLRGDKEKLELHEFWCGEWFGWVYVDFFGMKKARPRRTTTRDGNGKRDKISAGEMADMYDFIQQRCVEFGLIVPDPVPNDMPDNQ